VSRSGWLEPSLVLRLPCRLRPAPQCTYGGLGCVGFAEEVRQQEKGLGFPFDRHRPPRTPGFAKDGRARRVIGIDASATPKQTKAQVIEFRFTRATSPARRLADADKFAPIDWWSRLKELVTAQVDRIGHVGD